MAQERKPLEHVLDISPYDFFLKQILFKLTKPSNKVVSAFA